jgi:hypothetical protein
MGTGCDSNLAGDSLKQDRRSPLKESKVSTPFLSSTAFANSEQLPNCDESRETQLTYILSEKNFYHCSSGEWTLVPIGETGAGEKGEKGEKGDPGNPGNGGSSAGTLSYGSASGAPNDSVFIDGDGHVAIGHTDPSRAIFEQHGMVGNTAAIFGGDGAGVAIIRDWPEINFNAYYNSGHKSISAGFGGSLELNPSNGDYHITSTSAAASAANEALTMVDRIRIKGTSGYVGIGTNNPADNLHVVGNLRVSGDRSQIRTSNSSIDQYSSTSLILQLDETTADHRQWSVFAEKSVAGAATGESKLQFRRSQLDGSEALTPLEINQNGHVVLVGGFTSGAQVQGNVGVATTDPTVKLDINSDTIRLRTPRTPATSSETCDQGEMAWDSDYVYVCIADDNWKRSALGSW